MTKAYTHAQFTLDTMAYKANNIAPGIDSNDGQLKIWHYGERRFVPFLSANSKGRAKLYCLFGMRLTLN